MTSRRAEDLERMLRRLVDEFEPSSPRGLDVYVDVDHGAGAEGTILTYATVPDGLDGLLEAAEILLNNTPEGSEEIEG